MDKSPFSFLSSTFKQTLIQQLNREAKWSIYLTLIYLVGWVVLAYFTPHKIGMFGLPIWFELSCLLLPLIFIILSAIVLKVVYQDVDLDSALSDTKDNT